MVCRKKASRLGLKCGMGPTGPRGGTQSESDPLSSRAEHRAWFQKGTSRISWNEGSGGMCQNYANEANVLSCTGRSVARTIKVN